VAQLDYRSVMTLEKLAELGQSNVDIAKTLGITEGAVRYHLKRPLESRVDGRAKKQKAAAYSEVIEHWKQHHEEADRGFNLAELHEYLVENFGYSGSDRSVQRYWKKTYPADRVFTRRRVETPPGAQAQVDWGFYPSVVVDGDIQRLYGLHVKLSSCRYPAIIWSRSKNQLAWHRCHIEALRRLGGVPATLRVDRAMGHRQ